MDVTNRKVLLQAARNAVNASLGLKAEHVDDAEQHPPLSSPGGAFVTLHLDDALRGCIGTFQADRPLAVTVREMAVAAATRDPRFPPVTPDEAPQLAVEISVLSPTRPARAEEVVVGLHGLAVARDFRRGVLLPQVAVEHRWSPEVFLAQTCRKAGLPADAWRDPQTSIEVFEAEVFGEA